MRKFTQRNGSPKTACALDFEGLAKARGKVEATPNAETAFKTLRRLGRRFLRKLIDQNLLDVYF
jgi:hypothetical protein